MPQNFKPCDRSQRFLLAPDMREWLPDDHLAFFILDTTEGLDLDRFYRSYRADGWGRAAFDPRMMVSLVLYAFAVGERSTRGIERRCTEDVAFRVITANETPDHSTIARFIDRHRDALQELLSQTVVVCVRAGLVRPNIVAVDGTKMAANAAQKNNLTEEQLSDFVTRTFDEFDRIQAEEDALYGERRGDELPEHLRDRESRRRWIREQLEAQKKAPSSSKRRGQLRVNTTDPDSRVMKGPQGYLQGYNAQVVATEDQVVIAADVTNASDDRAYFKPMVKSAQDNLAQAGAAPVGTALADAGYFSADNITAELGCHSLIAPVATRWLGDALKSPPDLDPDEVDLTKRDRATEREEMKAQDDHRIKVLKRVIAKEMKGTEAARELGLSEGQTSRLKSELLKRGPDTVRRVNLPKDPSKPPPAKDVGLAIFARPGALETYNHRSTIVEPVFGQTKEARRMRKFLRRGLGGTRCEWSLMMATHNLRKAWRAAQPSGRLPSSLFSRYLAFGV